MNSDESKERSSQDVILMLGGSALKVYLYLLKVGRPVGIREVQRALGFKAPSTAKYHLDRLASLGLIEKTPNGYRVRESVKGHLLSIYVSIIGSIVPRVLPIAIFLSIGLALYIVLAWPNIDLIPTLLTIVATIYLWIEGVSLHKWLKRAMKR